MTFNFRDMYLFCSFAGCGSSSPGAVYLIVRCSVLVGTGPVFPGSHWNVRRVEKQPRALPHYQRPAHFHLQLSGIDHRHHHESHRDLPCAQQIVMWLSSRKSVLKWFIKNNWNMCHILCISWSYFNGQLLILYNISSVLSIIILHNTPETIVETQISIVFVCD